MEIIDLGFIISDDKQELVDMDRVAYEALVPVELHTPGGAWFGVVVSSLLTSTYALVIIFNDPNNLSRGLPYLPQDKIKNALNYEELQNMGFGDF